MRGVIVLQQTRDKELTEPSDQTATVCDADDFERFVHILGHDLRACARALSVLPTWIEEDVVSHAPELMPLMSENITMMKTQSVRLDRMLVDLLEFSQVGRLQNIETISIATVVEKSLQKLGMGTNGTTTTRIELSKIRCGPDDARRIFDILLSNAQKHGAPPFEVQVYEADGCCVIHVADAGHGIPFAHRGKVLEPMSTLQSRDAIEGSGMGLAILQKIAAIYQGSITWRDVEDSASTQAALVEIHLPLAS
ncbi:HAMP domain-containing sensor histidine kinase [Ascidiaceihabitans sp.]|uniref:sensor histidine kinase n=1 Tax=Ascidiaceihabitans sp. TaxID=1872644 RepID=UPI0032975670